MPRFFIDTDDGVTPVRDPTGQELASAQDARDLAHRALSDMARQTLPDGECLTFTAEIRDETGTILYVATMSLHGEWNVPPVVI